MRAFKTGNLGSRLCLLVAITCERVLLSTGPDKQEHLSHTCAGLEFNSHGEFRFVGFLMEGFAPKGSASQSIFFSVVLFRLQN